MIITPNKVIQKAIVTLYDAIRESPYDSEFSWDNLRELAGLPENTDIEKVYYVANRVCLLLMKHDQKYLNTVHNYGKRIVRPSEHSRLAKDKARKSVKIYRRAGQIISCTNLDELSEEQKNEVIMSANKYSTLEMFASELIRRKPVGVTSTKDIETAGLFLDTINFFTKRKS